MVMKRAAALPASDTRIWATVDLNQDGRQAGHLRLPFSTDVSAYGTIAIPIVSVRNGEGPTALLIAGSHGDEYEGQVALSRLARSIERKDVQGRILILPHLNLPAARAGRRLSPLDDGNLNRLFPGDPNGSPTEMIAGYVTSVLLPLADFVLDLHSGGRSLEYLPCSLIRSSDNQAKHAELVDLARVFGAPICSISDGSGGGGATTLSATAQAVGIPVLTAELGGGGGFSSGGAALATQGTLRVLHHVGVLRTSPTEPPATTRFMQVVGRDAFVYATAEGIFEPLVDIGAPVEANAIGGHLHPMNGGDPIPISFPSEGLLACRRAIALTREGDCLFKILNDANP